MTSLLRLLAYAVRVEPALLRAVRHLLPARQADVGSEAAIWRHPDVRDDGITWVLRAERQEAYRDAAVAEEAAELRAQAVALMRRRHQGLSPAIRRDREIPVPEADRLLIQGNFEKLEIDGLERPDWALIQQAGGRLELKPREDPPGTLCWLRPGGFRQPDWADAIGLDRYGLWADLRYRGVTQRFRWIAPGELLMGSPEDEAERRRDETRHEVILTRGFWLGETPVTQALWEAALGDNPSRFKGAERPVKQARSSRLAPPRTEAGGAASVGGGAGRRGAATAWLSLPFTGKMAQDFPSSHRSAV